MIDALHDGSATALLRWWLVLAGLTAAWFPLASRLWPGGTAWCTARVLAMLATAYALWLPATPGWPLPAWAVAAPLAAAAWAAATWAAGRAAGRHRSRHLHQPATVSPAPDWAQALRDEAAFAALLLLWCGLRAARADLGGTEKFMDHALLLASLQAVTLPPPDLWWAGGTVNYYYFGHWLSAVLARLADVPAPFAYNLMLCTVAALAMATAGALARELIRRLQQATGLVAAGSGARAATAGGVLAAVLIGFGGNLHTLLHGVLPALAAAFTGRPWAGYHYPLASRFIGAERGAPEHLITEFPAYSFVVGDLHAHLLGLPLSLGLLCLLHGAMADARPAAAWRRAAHRAAVAGLLGAMAMTNSWSFPIYLLLAGLAAACLRRQAGARGWRWAAGALAEGVALGALALLAALPFFWRFEPFNRGFALAERHTAPRDLAMLWGGPLALVGGCLALAWWAARQRPSLRARLQAARGAALFPALLVAVALACIAAGETVVVLDIYGDDYRRANTVFKLGYEAHGMLTVCAAVAATVLVLLLGRLPRLGRAPRAAWLGGVWLACMAPLSFAAFALPQGFGPFDRTMTLDALAGLQRTQPDDRQAIDWLRTHVAPGSTVLEVDGFSYTYAGRIATATGLPTVLGWRAHQELWRKQGKPQIEQRALDVEAIYRAQDCALASRLLARYGIVAIVLGAYEHERLPGLEEARLLPLAEPAARFGRTLVLRVRPEAQRCAAAG